MCRKMFLVLGVGLLVGFGLTLGVGADDTGLERPGFALTTLDGPGNVGQYTSVTIGADGLGLISYRDVTNRNLKVAHCSNRACTAATLSTLDSTGDVGCAATRYVCTNSFPCIGSELRRPRLPLIAHFRSDAWDRFLWYSRLRAIPDVHFLVLITG